MYLVFARKYRPRTFDDVVGQNHVAHTLKNAVLQQRVAHAYLFCGSRGVGKTSMARILASALNCTSSAGPDPCGNCEHCTRIAAGQDLDVIEIDGASNRGIDEVRELRQNVKISPSYSRQKIYYIDEVHMLTSQAFNALLKTLEEPPEHVKFIFSTTDPQQLPETVKSRCQRFDFRRISDAEIINHLRFICEKEALKTEKGALPAIARAARGGMRDALGTLDQVTAFSDSQVKLEDVLTVLGAARTTALSDMICALSDGRTADALTQLHSILFSGVDLLDLIDQLSEYLRDLLVSKYCSPGNELLAGAIADEATLKTQSDLFTPEQLLYMLQILRESRQRARRDTTGKLALELALIKLARLDELIKVSKALEPEAHSQQSSPTGKSQRRAKHSDSGKHPTPGNAPQPGNKTDSKSRIKSMINKLQARRTNNEPVENPEGGDDFATEDIPEGMKAEKFRRIMNVAGSSTAANEAVNNKPLIDAFLKADRKFGLTPLELYRTGESQEGENGGQNDSD